MAGNPRASSTVNYSSAKGTKSADFFVSVFNSENQETSQSTQGGAGAPPGSSQKNN